jgi:RNA polymerase primary sigma factor
MNRRDNRRFDFTRAYFQEISDAPLLSRAEELELADRIAQGDPEARDRMARANLRLVVNLARRYLGRGLSLEDLVAEGNLGLMRAVEGFDSTKDTRFATYATYWIKQSLRAAVQKQGRMVRMPAYTHRLLVKWQRVSEALKEELGRAPTEEEIGRVLHFSKRKLKVVRESLQAARLTTGSLDDPDNPAWEGVTAELGQTLEQVLDDRDVLARISSQLASMDCREAAVIRMRFGIGGTAPKNLREIGEQLGLTRERVRQLEKKAMSRLRNTDAIPV